MSEDLQVANEQFSLAPFWVIRANLNRIFGGNAWKDYELETIGMELGVMFDELLRDKITVLQLLEHGTVPYFEDLLFFLHSTNVLNNSIANFDTMPMPSSLEIAFASMAVVHEYGITSPEFSTGIKKTVNYILTQEGWSDAIAPFNTYFGPLTLEAGQTQDDTDKKAQAVKLYIKAMSKWPL